MRKIKTLGQGRKKLLLSGDHLTILGFMFGANSISEEVAGFSPFMVSPRKNILFIVSCVLIAAFVILSVKYPNIMLA